MSYQDKLQNATFTITTGDGEVYTPLWKPETSSKEYNASKYDFINVAGSRIDRKLRQSNKYPLTFWFQGDDHLDTVASFMASADDVRAWEIDHPYYGFLIGQPLSISRNDTAYGITEITVDFWESILSDFPDDEVSPRDRVEAVGLSVQAIGADVFAAADLSSAIVAPLKLNATQSHNNLSKQSGDVKVDLDNSLASALKAADNVLSASRTAITANQSITSKAVLFDTPVGRKVKALIAIYNELKGLIENRESKFLFESQGATLISNITTVAVNPLETDYTTRAQVAEVSASILETYADYQNILDENTVGPYEVEKTWNPNTELQTTLNQLVLDTVANLQVLSFEAKQERIIRTEKNTNIILMTHKYMGEASEENLQVFREINNIKNDELFLIKKGRELKYYA